MQSDKSADHGAFISLSDAWARFCDHRDHKSFFDPLKMRPHFSQERDLVRNPKTRELKAANVDGAPYAEGNIDEFKLAWLTEKFFHEVVRAVPSFVVEDGAPRPADPSEWFDACKPALFDPYIYSPGPPSPDGNPKTWSAVRAGTAFPIAVVFDRSAFESCPIWHPNVPTEPETRPDLPAAEQMESDGPPEALAAGPTSLRGRMPKKQTKEIAISIHMLARYPMVRPSKSRSELRKELSAQVEGLGSFSDSTLDRGISRAYSQAGGTKLRQSASDKK